MKKFLVIILATILVGGGIYWFVVREDGSSPTNNQATQDTAEDTIGNITTPGESIGIEIIYTDDGFSPEDNTVASGLPVTIQNNSSSTLDFASNDHPVHQDNTELNVGSIAPGASKTFAVTEKGSWGFHNHNNDTHEGTITVN